MSGTARHWAKGITTGRCARKAVLQVLCDDCDQWGYVWTGEKRIAREAELSERQVRRILRDLADVNLFAIFQTRGPSGQTVNLYRMAFAARPDDPMPGGHPSLNDKYEQWRGPEKMRVWGDPEDSPPRTDPEHPQHGGPEDTMSGGPEDTMSSNRRTNRTNPEDKSHQPGGQVMSSEPLRTYKNLKARARARVGAGEPARAHVCEPDRPEGPVSPPAPGEENNPVNAYWTARQDALKKLVTNDVDYRAYLGECIAHSDDGEVLVLAVPSRWLGEQVRNHYGWALRTACPEREIRFTVTDYAKARSAKRRAAAREARG